MIRLCAPSSRTAARSFCRRFACRSKTSNGCVACGGGAPGATLAKARRRGVEERSVRREKRCMMVYVVVMAATLERTCDCDFSQSEQWSKMTINWCALARGGGLLIPDRAPSCWRGLAHSTHSSPVPLTCWISAQHRQTIRMPGKYIVIGGGGKVGRVSPGTELGADVSPQVALKFASSAVKQGSKVISVVRNDSQ